MTDHLPDFDSLWDYDDPKATEDAFRALLPVARANGDGAYLAELLTQMARAQALQRAFDEAHRTLDEAETLLDEAERLPGDASARARIRYLLERGRTINSAGQPSGACDYFLRAWRLATEQGEDVYAIDAAHMLGIVEPPAEQLNWNQRALEVAERSAEARARRWRGSLLNNLGWTYHALGRYAEALAIFEQTRSYYEERGQQRETRIAAWCMGRTLRSLDRFSEALDLQREVLEQVIAAGDDGGFSCEEIAECLLALGRAEEARTYFARAHAALSRDAGLVATDAARLRRLQQLADA